jgi:hypothetical protein
VHKSIMSCGERAIVVQDGPEDEPQPDYSRVRHIRHARKSHPCGHCHGGTIQPGQPYIEYVEIDNGRFMRQTYCAGGPCTGELR